MTKSSSQFNLTLSPRTIRMGLLYLAFELLADGQVTPVSAGYLFVKTLRSGYVRGCGTDGDEMKLLIDDSYQEDALHLDIRLKQDHMPVSAEILYKDRRFLSMDIKNFRLL